MSMDKRADCQAQRERNEALIAGSHYMRDEVTSSVLPLTLDPATTERLTPDQAQAMEALSKDAARIALASLADLAKIGELDHLGGALELIPAMLMTLALTDYEKTAYTIEHAHTSIGHYAALAALGFLDREVVIREFRRSLDIPGHVSWVPGGTELNGGRLGVMIPAAVGQALGMRALAGKEACMFCHCGDAGWISGQALNGFHGADYHHAPIVFVMHRNGIQLSGTNKEVMDKDPRPIIEAMGIRILETTTIHDPSALYDAYREAYLSAIDGRPTLIYPTGYRSAGDHRVDLNAFAEQYGLQAETAAFAAKHGVNMDTEVWIPGSLMSWRDVGPMLECLFHVNELPGGEGHHDGHMKGRDLGEVLAHPLLTDTPEETAALAALRGETPRAVTTAARPRPGSENLLLTPDALAGVELPPVGKKVSPRAGSEAAYAAVAKAHPENVFVVSCDLNPSTKLAKACAFLAPDHQFEMSIEEQASLLMTNGLAVSSRRPQLNVVSTFAAFFEGIAREGFDMWRYQRNLNGANEGLNVAFHMSHVGACTGRDHFSGWGLDWINVGLCYLPYLHRFYAPADARAAFVAVKDLAAHYGGHVIGIPRDNLPILEKQDGSGPLWEATDEWEAVTPFRRTDGAKKAILALGATAFLAEEAVARLAEEGVAADAYVVNGLPLPQDFIGDLLEQYPEGLVTVEDGLIDCPGRGLRGFAGLVSGAAYGSGVPLSHVGIVSPKVAPSEGHMEVWEHFGITTDAVVQKVKG
jgi:transketolase